MENRYTELDSLRGLAAISVFFSHVVQVSVLSTLFLTTFNNSIIHVLWDGGAAVDLFFVLSGFVLAIPYVGISNRTINVGAFLVRRIFRIYPAYYVALVSAFLLHTFLYQPTGLAGLSHWAVSMWPTTSSTFSWSQTARLLLLVLPLHDVSIDPVIWSLVIEMRVSLIFPLFLFLIRKTNRPLHLICVAMISLGIALFNHGENTSSLMLLFLLGGYLAKYREPLVKKIIDWSPVTRYGLIGSAVILYSSRYCFPHVILGDRIANYLSGIGSAIMIVSLLANPTWSKWLLYKPVRFIGKISYGFYLFHLPLLVVCLSVLMPVIHSELSAVLLSFSLTITVSWFVNKVIEVPLQRLGRHFSKLFLYRRGDVKQSIPGSVSRT